MKKSKNRAGLNRESRRWLEAASRWRLLSLFFQLPTPDSRRELRRLAGSVPKDLAKVAREWTTVDLKLAAAEFHRVLGAGGIPAVESSYDPNALAGRGPLLADIAGFHEAFAYRPEKRPAEVPDHIAVELDFLSYLSFKVAFALHEGRQEEARIATQGHNRFLEQHLATWVPAFREKLEGAGSAFFVRAAASIKVGKVKKKKVPRLLPVLAVILLVCLCLGPAGAQPAQEKPQEKTAASAGPATNPKAGGVTFSGSLRGRVENWSWFETPGAEDSYTFGAFQLRLALAQKTEHIDWQVEGIFPVLMNLPTGAVRPPPEGQLGLGGSYFAANGRQDASAVFRQGFVRFKGILGDTASSLRLGRFEFAEGAEVMPADPTLAAVKRTRIAQRLVGAFGFSHVGRGFDGVEYVRKTESNNFTFLAARPTEGVFQLRSLHELDIDFYYGALTRQFVRDKAKSEVRVFALHYHDGRLVLKTDNRPQALRAADTRDIRLTSLGGHYLGAFGKGPGKTDLLVWGVGQFGHWGLLDHRAGAIAIEGGYQFPAPWKPWVRAGYFRSTGDGDSADDKHTTFFQVLPTPRVYARFPIYNLMNNQDLFGELRLRPVNKLSLSTQVRYLRLSNRQDLWYAGGGAFQKQTFGYLGRPSNGQSGVGTLFDLSIDYQFTSTTAVTFYLAGLHGSGVQAAIYPAGGDHPGARFLYFEFVQRF